jgi:hypothetical protein
MRAALFAFAFALAGCNANPLLKMAAADYAPLRAGSNWVYVDSAGAAAFTTRVLSVSGQYMDVANYEGLPGTSTLRVTGAMVEILGAQAQVDRKLPYVTGNKWNLFAVPGSTSTRSVDGYETLLVPAGRFERCFRLKTETAAYNSGTGLTTTTGGLIWAAPSVGDLQYASVDAAGNVAVTASLASYSLGP